MDAPPTSGLPLPNLTVRRFRLFEDLSIGKLARINCVVGRNGAGKSSLLEAIRVYASGCHPQTLFDLLVERDESQGSNGEGAGVSGALVLPGFFHGAKEPRSIDSPVEIISGALGLSISFSFFREVATIGGGATLQRVERPSIDGVSKLVPGLVVTRGGTTIRTITLDLLSQAWRTMLATPDSLQIPCAYVGPGGIRGHDLAAMWDTIALTPAEDEITGALRLIAPGVERITFVAAGREERKPWVRVQGFARPVPLRSLGDGATRLLGMLVALVKAEDGVLLIDEVENGIHYSVQSGMWKLLYESCVRLNVQLFATTHSWDCVRGFQQATESSPQGAGQLIRLGWKGGRIEAHLFDQEDLAIATHESVEIR